MSTALQFHVTGEHFVAFERNPRFVAIPGFGRPTKGFETPALAPMHAQVRATVLAVKTMLAEFRKLQAYAPNL